MSPLQVLDDAVDTAAVRAVPRLGSPGSSAAVAGSAQVDRIAAPPAEAGPDAEGGDRISWPRAVALLVFGCVALAVALCCGVFAAGFAVAALIEPHDVLLAAREAVCGLVLLGAGVSAGLTWCLVAAVGSEACRRPRTSERRRG
jgi:hypothetical protein